MKTVVVVVLSWNKKQMVIDCIHRAKTLVGADVHIVIVDNASSDDSVAAIKAAHPDVTVLQESRNRGYAGGVNRGLAEAARRDADYAWLLNDDTTFASDTLAGLLADAATDARCGLRSPALRDLEHRGGEQFSRGLIDWERGVMRYNLPETTHAQRVAAAATPIVAGTAMLCDLRVYRTIGPFDERFFAYWEDTDYSVRTAAAGYSNVVVPSAIVHHAAPSIVDRPPHYHYYMVRNEALFWRLHGRAHRSSGWRRRWLIHTLESVARARDLGLRDHVSAVVDGLWDALGRRYGSRADHRSAPRWFAIAVATKPHLVAALVRGSIVEIFKRTLRGR